MDLRGASAEALTDLTGRLDDAIGGVRQAADLADELFTVSRLFRTEAALRRFATDASLPAEAKQGMVQQVFKDRLDERTLDLLTEAAGRRWTLSRDLPDVLERLSEIAVVRSAGAKAGQVSDEVFQLARIIDGDPALRDALSDPGRSVDDKAALLDSLLGDVALPATVTLAKQALSGTYRTMTAALATYRVVAAESQGEAVATVRVARALSAADQRRLGEILNQQYDTTVRLNVIIDPDVIGGIRVEIGDQVIDGTISGRLDDARRRLAG
ncbi:F0F1 ATP synthase subunit delta [Nocardioides cynanchi]|uniref:F0F1 ATP synthase subunit delta n=1 Tax=Nocardioides cynanchi TaxID=2558918 RepID=UPI0012458F10|nr:F0F1 ATP synthase subunit delta [Nocardioides cynanchi]